MPGPSKRLRLHLLAAILTALVIIYLFRPWWESSKLGNEAKVAKIRRGMTKGEVEAILGGPAGNYTTKPALAFASRSSKIAAGEGGGSAPMEMDNMSPFWNFDDGTALVYMDPDEKVTDKQWFRRESKGLIDIISDLLRKIGL